MDRMGHDSGRAAMIYLHGSDARQHQIADSLSKLTRAELKTDKRKPGEKRSDATGTKQERGFVKITGSGRETGLELGSHGCAPGASRTRDLLLRRHIRQVAQRRWTWPDVPLRSSGCGWMWPGVAWWLGSLAPSLAPICR
jgi:hypothetical protein